MTFAEFASLIRFRSRTNATTFLDADILLLANTHKDNMTLRILGANENYFGNPLTINLASGTRQYDFDDTIAGQIKLVMAKLDGTNWKRLYETDFNMTNMPLDETSIINAYTGRDAQFAVFDQQFWILSGETVPTVSGGLKVYAFTWPAKFTDLSLSTEMSVNASTTAHGWPREFQELLADRVVIDYKSSQDKPIPLTQNEQLWEQRMQQALEAISNPNLDRSVLATVPDTDDTGEEVC